MIKKTIRSYLYQQYSDDTDLQAFVKSYNVMTQEYIDWFNNINLPIYTGLSSGLLDWVGEGLYGIKRPTITYVKNPLYGTYNNWAFNTITYNALNQILSFTLNDDIYKRVITWKFYKGDGFNFNIIWLKRRVERFLFGVNGGDYTGTTYRVSVSFQSAYVVVIRIINSIITSTTGMLYNRFQFNSFPFNKVTITSETLPRIPLAGMLKTAIDAGVLELPFQFQYIVLAS